MAGMRNNPSSNFGNGSEGPSKKPEYLKGAENVAERANQRERVTRDSREKLKEFRRSELVERLREAEQEIESLQGILRDAEVLKDSLKNMDSERESFTAIVANLPKNTSIGSGDIILLLSALGRKDDEQLPVILDNVIKDAREQLVIHNKKVDELEQDIFEFNYGKPEERVEEIKEPIEETPEETVEEVKVDPEKAIKSFMNRVENGMIKAVSPGTNGLNRIQELRHVYTSEIKEGNGYSDQAFLQKAIEVVAGNIEFNISQENVDALLENLDMITDRQAINILGAYQQVRNLKVDGKFGPDTFNALREDLGVKIIDRSTGEFVDKYKE